MIRIRIICNVTDDIFDNSVDTFYSNEEIENTEDKRPKFLSQGAHYALDSKRKMEIDRLLLVIFNCLY